MLNDVEDNEILNWRNLLKFKRKIYNETALSFLSLKNELDNLKPLVEADQGKS